MSTFSNEVPRVPLTLWLLFKRSHGITQTSQLHILLLGHVRYTLVQDGHVPSMMLVDT